MGKRSAVVARRRDARSALVSVIIPTFERAELLTRRAIPSVLRQTHRNLELLVIGDGCTQATLDLMGDIPRLDPRITFTNRPRPDYPPGLDGWHIAGSYAANYGLDVAKGSYVCFLGDDDEYLPTFIEDTLDGLIENDAGAAYCASEVVGQGYLGCEYPPQFARQSGGELLFRKTALRLDVECWRQGLPNDWDFWQRLMATTKFAHVRKCLYRYFPGTHVPPCHASLPWTPYALYPGRKMA